MPSTLLPILPGTLPPQPCYSNEQQRLNAYAEAMSAKLEGGLAFYNFGDSLPSAANRIYPWFRTTDSRWYFFSGDWISRVAYSVHERRIFVGTLSQLETYDGGDANAPSDRSGPMWQADSEFAAKFPVGVGSLPGGTVIGELDSGGSETATLTTANLPGIQRLDPSDTDPGLSDNFFNPNAYAVDVDIDAPWIRKSIVGTSTPFSVVPPYIGVFFIKWTGRIFYKV